MYIKAEVIFIAIRIILNWINKLGYTLTIKYLGGINKHWVISMNFA